MEIELQIQEWFAACTDFEDLTDIYYRIRKECDKQMSYMGMEIANRKDGEFG